MLFSVIRKDKKVQEILKSGATDFVCHQKCLDIYVHKKTLDRLRAMEESKAVSVEDEQYGSSSEFPARLSKRKKAGTGKDITMHCHYLL